MNYIKQMISLVRGFSFLLLLASLNAYAFFPESIPNDGKWHQVSRDKLTRYKQVMAECGLPVAIDEKTDRKTRKLMVRNHSAFTFDDCDLARLVKSRSHS